MWKAELRKQLLDSLIHSNLPDLLINRDTVEKNLLECPSALKFCTSSHGINEVCRDSDYILHCKLKAFMMRKNARVGIFLTTMPDSPPVGMKIYMQCTENEMRTFIIGMLYMAQRLGIRTFAPASNNIEIMDTTVFGNRVRLEYDPSSVEFAFSSGTATYGINDKQCQWSYIPPFSPVDIPDDISQTMDTIMHDWSTYEIPSKWLLDARQAELKTILQLLDFDALQMKDLYTKPLSLVRTSTSGYLEYEYIFQP